MRFYKKIQKINISYLFAIVVVFVFLLIPFVPFPAGAEETLASGGEKTLSSSKINIGNRITSGLSEMSKIGFGVKVEEGEKIPLIHPAAVGFGVLFVIVGMVGLFFFGLMLYSGYLWLTAYGDEEKAKKALNVARRAIVGLGIVLSSYLITIAAFYYLTRVAGGEYYYPPGSVDYWRDWETGY